MSRLISYCMPLEKSANTSLTCNSYLNSVNESPNALYRIMGPFIMIKTEKKEGGSKSANMKSLQHPAHDSFCAITRKAPLSSYQGLSL